MRQLAKKASIQLSINMLVRLIIAVIVFGLGMLIVKQIFFSANVDNLSPQLSNEVENQIKLLLDTGERITVYPEQATVNRGKTAVFGIGVLNVLGADHNPAEFYVDISCSGYVDDELQDCPADLPKTFSSFEPLEIYNNEDDYFTIPLRAEGVDTGTYIFNAIISYDDTMNGVLDEATAETYGIVKFRLEVK